MRACGWWLAALLLAVTRVTAAPSSEEDKTGSPLQESIKEEEDSKGEKDGGEVHHRVVRQLLDGFRFENTLKDGILALENVDEMLRTTIPTIDRFQCIERLMCSMMSSSSDSSSITSLLGQAFDPSFQQGVIQDSQSVQQEVLQSPALQGLFSQNPSLESTIQEGLPSINDAIQQGLSSLNSQAPQGFPPPDPAFQQGFPPPNPAFQQGFPPPNPAFQQGFPPPNPAFQQGFASPNPAFQQGFPPPNPAFQQGFPPPNPAFQGFPPPNPAFQQGFLPQGSEQNPTFLPPPPPPPGFQAPSDQDGTSFQNTFPNFRENPDTENTLRRTNGPPRPLRRRRPSRRPQRNGFFDFLGRLGLGRRKKRSLIDNIFSGLGGDRIMGLLDQMMTQYSFYPYTHAAFMGYSGSPRRCETLYPSCPSTAEEMIEVFNNIHRHYPDGIPYKESLPWPLNILLP